MAESRKTCLGFSVLVLSLINLWPSNDDFDYNKKRFLKDISLIMSLMPCALPILADFCLQLYEGVSDLTALIENLIALNCIVAMIYMVICFIKNRKLIKALVKQISQFEFCGKSPLLEKTDDKANLYTKLFVLYGVLGNVIYMLMPQLNVKACKESRSQNMIAEGIPCGLVTRCRLPFKFDYSPVFEIIFLHQIYTCTVITIVILILTMLLCGILMHIIHQLEYLRSFIYSMTDLNNLKLLNDIHKWIKFHNDIINYSQKTSEAFRSMMLVHLTLTSVVISVLGFQVLAVESIYDSVRFSLHLVGWLVLLLLVCYYGQQLADKSTSIALEVYFVAWFKLPVLLQQHLRMIIMRSQKPLALSAAHLGDMTLPTFLRVLSSAYSFLTLLLKIKP